MSNPNCTQLNVQSPRKLNADAVSLIEYLDLESESFFLLKYRAPIFFKPEPNNCHFNVWIYGKKHGGSIQSGWIIGQDKKHYFTEARFHTVWRSPGGELKDVTPREDKEKRIMFLPDTARQIVLTDHEGVPAIITYDKITCCKGKLQSELREIKVVPISKNIYKHGLATKS